MVPASSAEPVVRSQTWQKFLSVVCSRPAAEFVDLGPVIGANITFLGERVGCKIHIEDLYADLEQHAQQGRLDRFAEFLAARFPLPDASIDAVLCWHVFDHLDSAAAHVLARELIRLLRPGGAVLAFFGAAGPRELGYTTYVIEDEQHLRIRSAAAAGGGQRVLQNRDIMNLFDGLLTDSVLRRSGVRELLVQKPASSP